MQNFLRQHLIYKILIFCILKIWNLQLRFLGDVAICILRVRDTKLYFAIINEEENKRDAW